MKSSGISLLCVACGMLLTVILPPRAYSTQLNINANECQPNGDWNAVDLMRPESGISGMPSDEIVRTVICPVPRSPLIAQSPLVVFVDGDNYNEATTECGLVSMAEDHYLASAGFQSSDAHYDARLALTAEQMSVRGYLYLICWLPAHGNGVLRGITTYP